jgi:hypothetical protein
MSDKGFYKGEKKKKKKSALEKQAIRSERVNAPPAVQIIGKGKKSK